jgi:hypothetical protein
VFSFPIPAVFAVPVIIIFAFGVLAFIVIFARIYRLRRLIAQREAAAIFVPGTTPVTVPPQQLRYGSGQVAVTMTNGSTATAALPQTTPGYQQLTSQQNYGGGVSTFAYPQKQSQSEGPSAPSSAELSSQVDPPAYDAATAYPPPTTSTV